MTLLVSVSRGEDAPASENVPVKLVKATSNDISSELNAEMELSKLKEAAEETEDLPILPPLILLDFAGDSDNSTSPDGKPKRTVDNGLGYGYLRNNLFNGKTNFYFPGGKSGTTVSIEESISPFAPKTIIESFKPITERPDESPVQTTQNYKQNLRATNPIPQSNNNNNNYASVNQAIFGQRTKLLKASPTDYSFKSYSTTPKSNIVSHTTTRLDYRGVNNNNVNTYTTPQSNYQDAYLNRQSYTTARPAYVTYPSTPSPAPTPVYDPRYTLANNVNQQRPSYDISSTPASYPTDPAVFNLPRFVVENGVRYENKIIWKYPDGRVINPVPPADPEYQNQPKINYQTVNYQNHQPAQEVQYPQEIYNSQNIVYQNPQGQYQDVPSARYQQKPPVSNIYSQRPAQFPKDAAEPAQPSRPSAFVSVNGGGGGGGSSQAQGYDFSYQSKYGLRERGNENGGTRYESRPIKYTVDNPNNEYVYTTESPPPAATTQSTKLFTTQGELSPTILSKYTPQAQKYLTKVFENNPEITTEQYHPQPAQYSNPNYENLLNYNPSISQYIHDPSSILNAQPTFIQAGKSLIPVIILRVDGVSPVQSKVTPNINLKALLQQYLSDYASSKAALSQNSNYEYANQVTEKPISQSPINELTQLTQVLSRFSPTYEHDSIASQKLAQLPLDYTPRPHYSDTSYGQDEKALKKVVLDDSRTKFGTRKINKLQKVKSVEIIEDPRYPNLEKIK